MKRWFLDNLPIVWFILIILVSALLVVDHVEVKISFENTMKKIDQLEGKNVKVEYDKIQVVERSILFYQS